MFANPFIPGKVAGQQALGRRVTFLDMHAYLELTDTYDNLHPNQGGYNKMATNWVTAVTNVISPTGDWAPPGLYRARGVTNRTQVMLTFSKPLAVASATNIANYTLFTSAGNWDYDWTFNYNAATYSTKNIYVLVRWGGTPQGTVPTILVQPVGKTIRSGGNVTLAVQAISASAYQWRRNGTAIPGATQTWLDLAPADVLDAGSYDVLVYGSSSAYTVSRAAQLNVIPLGTLLKVQ